MIWHLNNLSGDWEKCLLDNAKRMTPDDKIIVEDESIRRLLRFILWGESFPEWLINNVYTQETKRTEAE